MSTVSYTLISESISWLQTSQVLGCTLHAIQTSASYRAKEEESSNVALHMAISKAFQATRRQSAGARRTADRQAILHGA